jgi:hypothetical protein
MPPKTLDAPPSLLTQFWNARGYLTINQLTALLVAAAEEEEKEIASEKRFNTENKAKFGKRPKTA